MTSSIIFNKLFKFDLARKARRCLEEETNEQERKAIEMVLERKELLKYRTRGSYNWTLLHQAAQHGRNVFLDGIFKNDEVVLSFL